MVNVASGTSPWLVVYRKNPKAVLRLFCFHYGGGSASAFRSWVDFLPTNIELVAVQLPGREGRFREAFVTKFNDLIDTLAVVMEPYLDKPYVVFGHSLGSIKSFEWIRELKRRGLKQPLLYIPSGMSAPQYRQDEPPISCLPEKEFIEELLKDYGSTLRTSLDKEELREVFLPQLRADFGLLESYQYRQGTKLDCPILAFAGEDELDIGDKELQGWSELTNGHFDSKRFLGDHFFIHSSENQVLDVVSQQLNKLTDARRKLVTDSYC